MRHASLLLCLLAALGCGRTPLLDVTSDGGRGGVRVIDVDGGSSIPGGGAGAVAPPPPPGSRCGNGRVEDGEQCDGRVRLGCADVGFGQGPLGCDRRSCQFDVSSCVPEPMMCTTAPSSLPPACLAALCQCDPMAAIACDGECFAQLECALKVCGVDRLDDRCTLDACPGFGSGQAIARQLARCIQGNPLCGRGSPPPPAACGNGIVESGEGCEGSDLRGQSCRSLGYDNGTLSCSARICQLDTSRCGFDKPFCGNGVVDAMEESCDGGDLAGLSCRALGLGRGELRCTASCSLDTSSCRSCGDGRLQDGESCDGMRLAGQSCISLGFSGGTLGCDGECKFDLQGCTLCGDGVIEAGENCDGSNLGGLSCAALGLGMGTLGCSPASCHFDTRGCSAGSKCGNGVAEADEQCDGMDLASHDCTSLGLGFEGGSLGCNSSTCRYDTSGCDRGRGSLCLNRCIEGNCASLLEQCEQTQGCEEVRTCLDGCREDPSVNCAARCIRGNPNAAVLAIVSSDCVADCAQQCR